MKRIGKYELEVIRFTGTCDVIVTSTAANSGLGLISKNGTSLNIKNAYVASGPECLEFLGEPATGWYRFDFSPVSYINGSWTIEQRFASNHELETSSIAWYNDGHWWTHEGKTYFSYGNDYTSSNYPLPDGTN
ncbi:MAG: hypothetical protein J6N21_23605 [Butyrivibrio sp.]|nr:hypothetical protein [Butyrivibrio sp.]